MKTKIIFLLISIIPVIVFSQWSDDPNVNTMVNDTIGSQILPKVVTNSQGETYISWFSEPGNLNFNVYLQKLDKNGMKMWDEEGLLISDHETMTWVTDYEMILDNEENIILANQDIRTGDRNVFAYKVSPDGDFLWGDDGIQLSNTVGFDPSPQVVVANNNDLVFMWAEEPVDTTVNSPIFIKRVSPVGNILWETTLSDTIYDYMLPQILHTDNDDFIVSWMTKTNLPDTTIGQEHWMHVFTQKIDANGNAVWAGKVQIDSGDIMLYLSLYTTPYLCSDGAGGAYVMWQSFFDGQADGNPTTYVNRIDENGNLWAPNGYSVSQNSGNYHAGAEMCYMENLDQLMVSWQEYHYNGTDCFGIYGQMFDSNGNYVWDSNGKEIIPLNCALDTSVFGVLLRESTNSNAVIVFQKNFLMINEGDTAIIDYVYAVGIDADGEKTWEPEPVPLSLTQSYKLHTAMGNLVGDQWVVAWEDNIENPHDNFNTGIYAQNITVDGQIGLVGIITQSTESNSTLSLFPNPSISQVNISFKLNAAAAILIDLLDINGQLISEVFQDDLHRGKYSTQMDVSGLTSGIYLIRLKENNTSSYTRLIKH